MKDVHAKRLLKLADFLDALPRKRFDFTEWSSDSDLHKCGTTACSLGWATAIPSFRRLGLRLINGLPAMPDSLAPYDVSRQLFGLEYEDHRHLFVEGLPDRATPKQAAKHIRAFVKGEMALPKGSADT